MKEATEKKMKDVRKHFDSHHPRNVLISSPFAGITTRDLVGTSRSF
jgi:hypothetical protein